MGKVKELNPKGITKEELEDLKGLNQSYVQIRGRVADAALFQKRAVDALDHVESRLEDFQNALAKKYGEDKKIDMTTGEFK